MRALLPLPLLALVAALSCAALSCAALGGNARAAEPSNAGPVLTLPWALAQLLPSPEVVSDPTGLMFAARWQLTPLLFSYGIHRSREWRYGFDRAWMTDGATSWIAVRHTRCPGRHAHRALETHRRLARAAQP